MLLFGVAYSIKKTIEPESHMPDSLTESQYLFTTDRPLDTDAALKRGATIDERHLLN